jgi:hypothetical protein
VCHHDISDLKKILVVHDKDPTTGSESGRWNGNHVRQRTAAYLSGNKQSGRHGHLALDHVKGALNFNGSKG